MDPRNYPQEPEAFETVPGEWTTRLCRNGRLRKTSEDQVTQKLYRCHLEPILEGHERSPHGQENRVEYGVNLPRQLGDTLRHPQVCPYGQRTTIRRKVFYGSMQLPRREDALDDGIIPANKWPD